MDTRIKPAAHQSFVWMFSLLILQWEWEESVFFLLCTGKVWAQLLSVLKAAPSQIQSCYHDKVQIQIFTLITTLKLFNWFNILSEYEGTYCLVLTADDVILNNIRRLPAWPSYQCNYWPFLILSCFWQYQYLAQYSWLLSPYRYYVKNIFIQLRGDITLELLHMIISIIYYSAY